MTATLLAALVVFGLKSKQIVIEVGGMSKNQFLDWRWRYRSAPCLTWDNSWQCEQKNS
jgi:hypothetical protein